MRLSLLATASLIALAAAASAQLSYATDFDAGYTPTTLSGQNGWVAGSGTANLPQVTNNASLSPNQSVLLATGTSGSAFVSSGRSFAAGTPTANTRILSASANIFVQNIAGADRYFGIGFATSTTPIATGGRALIALGGNGLRGGAGSYASFNSLTGGLLQARTTADFFGRWITVLMVADRGLTTNNVTFKFSGLGTSGGAATETFTRSADLTGIGITNLQIVSDYGTTSTVQGSAFVDNVRFAATPVPEPASMVALGLGAAAMLRRRRK